MRLEVQSAAEFLMNMLRVPVTPSIKAMSEPQLLHFKGSLQMLLVLRYRSHWYPDTPNKGSGYRCIRINSKMDPLVAQAGRSVGCSSKVLSKMLPPELTLWVDPEEVSYRIGENGSICVLYDSQSRSSPSSDSESIDSSDDLFMEQISRIDSDQILELMENSDFLNSLANSNRLNTRLDSSGSADSSLRSPPPSSPLQMGNARFNQHHQQQQQHHHHHQHQQHHHHQQHHNHQQQRLHQHQHLQYNNVMHHRNGGGGGNSPHQSIPGSMNNSNCLDSRLYHWEGFVNNNSNNNKIFKWCFRFWLSIIKK